MVEAGRLTPSGSNSQNVRYIVVQKDVEDLEDNMLMQYKKLRKSLGIAKKEKIVICLAVGYPAVTYRRSAPKKSANTIWL